MINLQPNEKILLTLHKHWIIFAAKMASVLMLGLLPLFLFAVPPSFIAAALPQHVWYPLSLLASALWWLILLLFFYVEWLDYWLDVWIITNLRIIDIEHHGLFRREASEFYISQVQDVTIETPGFLGTMFGFGNITVQTAGEVNFSAQYIVNVESAKKCILDCSYNARLLEQQGKHATYPLG